MSVIIYTSTSDGSNSAAYEYVWDSGWTQNDSFNLKKVWIYQVTSPHTLQQEVE